jgi:hypothetical protein
MWLMEDIVALIDATASEAKKHSSYTSRHGAQISK